MKGTTHQTLAEGKDDFFVELADQLRHEGFQEGMLKGLQEGIEFGIELRFGNASHDMCQAVECIHDMKKLQIVKDAIRQVKSTDELSSIIKSL